MRNYTAKAEAAFDQVTDLIHKAETLLDEAISDELIYKDHLDKDDLRLDETGDIIGVHTRLQACAETMDKVWATKRKEQTHA